MAFRGIQSTNIISTEVGFTDPVLVLNKDGSTAVDVGFLGKIGSTSYAGLVKDSTTEDFLLIKSISINSSSVNDIDATDLSLVKGDLQVDTVTGDLIGDVTGQVSSISNFNTDSLSEGASNLYYTDARVDARAQLKIDAIVDSSPGTLDTLNELAAALGDDANFSTTVTNSIAAKLPLAGGTMTGDLIMDANEIHLADNGEIRLGNAADFVIYHDGSDSVIKDKGTGNLSVRTNGNFYLMNEAGTETIIRADVNGSVDLYYDNSKKIETTIAGITVLGDIDTTGNVTRSSGNIAIKPAAGQTLVYYNNSLKLETTSAGITVTGAITASGDITAYSDDSLKTNVQVIDNAVGKVEQLRGVTFDRIEDGSTSTGVIAQELKEVLPEAVHTDEQGVHSVAYGNVVGLLIEAIKEQQKQIDELIKANKS